MDGVKIEIDGHFNRKPKIPCKKTLELIELIKEANKELGLETKLRSTGGCCDGNNLAAAGLPNIDTLGVRGAFIHSDKEYVCLDSLTERTKLATLLLIKLANKS